MVKPQSKYSEKLVSQVQAFKQNHTAKETAQHFNLSVHVVKHLLARSVAVSRPGYAEGGLELPEHNDYFTEQSSSERIEAEPSGVEAEPPVITISLSIFKKLLGAYFASEKR